jgi:FkbM family methyltransferase
MINTAKLFSLLPRMLRRHKLMSGWIALTRQDPVQQVLVNGNHPVYVDLSDGFMRLIIIDGGYDQEFFRVAEPFLREGGDFLDLGANYGICSFGLSNASSKPIRFHLVEANPGLIPILERTKKLYPDHDFQIIHKCISDRCGEIRFAIKPEQTGASHVAESGEDATVVPATTIDEYIESSKIEKVALLKIDVEGHEFPAFRGATNSMKAGKLPAIYFEHFPRWAERQGHSPTGIIEFLQEHGYQIFFTRSDDPNIQAQNAIVRPININGFTIDTYPIRSSTIEFDTDLLALSASAYNQ